MRRAKFLLGLLPSVLWAQNTPVDTTKTKTKEIDEVIITGFQKIEKSKITSSVDVVKMKDIEQKAVASIDQMLQGRVPGLLVTPASGTPGQIAPIRLRGTASLSGPTDPLWVIDGMPLEMGDAPKYDAGKDINDLKNYSIAGFNPEDIESITVLKDASATAIYGARAANGVILVTTKSGKKGRMNVNFSASTFVNLRPNFSKLNLMNSNQKVDWELMMASRSDLDNYRKDNGEVARILLANNDWNLFRSGGFSAISEASQREINALRNVNTNWGNLLYRTAINKQYSVSLSGGLDNYAYYASLGYYDEQSTVIGSGFERLNLTFKNDFKINNKIKVGLSIFGTNTKQSSFLSDASGNITPTYYSRSANPYLRPKDENGNYVYDPNVNYMDGDARIPYNYMEEKDNTRYDLNTKSLRGILNLDYKIFKFLEFRSQLGIQYENQKTEKYATEQTYFLRKRRDASKITSGGTTTYIIPKGDYYNISNGNSFEYNFKNILEFSKKINRHDVNLLVGSEIRETKYTSVNSQMYGYNPRQKTSIPLNIPNSEMRNANYLPVVDTEVSNAYASFFGTTSYTFANRYTFFGSVR
jgi:tonB-dependent receptor, plug